MTMRNDATRIRIATNDKRRPRAVVARQGQVLLDTDVDQQSRHHLDRIELETLDTLGSPGRFLVPAGTSGFKATSANIDIAAGRGYLDGWLLENPTDCNLATQPHPRSGDALGMPVVVGLKALIRHVDPVEEPVLADVALGDAQASGRSLVDWQVMPLSLPGANTSCANVTSNPTWQALIAPSTGTLTVIEQAASPSSDPCSLTPAGGYTRLENLLYRVEVHDGDPASQTIDGPRFKLNRLQVKLSRRNASVMVRIAAITGREIQVAPAALDPRNWFAPGQFAEIVSIHDDVDPRPALAAKRLFRVALATDDRVTLEATVNEITATHATNDGKWFLRLWDAFPGGAGVAVATVAGNAGESAAIDLGDGLLMKLGKGGRKSTGTFRRGDYWTFAARADGSIDWPKKAGSTPQTMTPEAMTPHGPEIRYAPLAVVTSRASTPEDCRIPFATLSDRALLYRGGDGQSVFPTGAPFEELPGTLRVAVMRGETPVAGATVRWSYLGPLNHSSHINDLPCDAANSVDTQTNADGLAEVRWALDETSLLETHKVQAAILTGSATSRPPIVFSASFATAQKVGYLPPSDACRQFAGIDNVAAELDALVKHACQERSAQGVGCCHTVGQAGQQDGEFPDIITAIEALRKFGHRYICLCLLPGEYLLERGALEEALGEEIIELEISGRGATLEIAGPLVFGRDGVARVERFVMRDLALKTRDGQALAFFGKKLPLDVELVDLSVSAAGSGGALLEFAGCRQVRILGCHLETFSSLGPRLTDLMPKRLADIVEVVGSERPSEVRTRFSSLAELAEGSRRAMVRDFERSIARQRANIQPEDAKILDGSLAMISAGGVPSAARFGRLITDWRHLVDKFGRRSPGWPVAIAFTELAPAGEPSAATDALIEDCRIQGGITIGTPDRDIDLETQAADILRNGRAGVIPDGFGRLRLDGNFLDWISLGSAQAERIVEIGEVAEGLAGLLFGEALVTRNTFTSAPQMLISTIATIHGNHFQRAQGKGVGLVASVAASATGNVGPQLLDAVAQLVLCGDPGAVAEAGNSRLDVSI